MLSLRSPSLHPPYIPIPFILPLPSLSLPLRCNRGWFFDTEHGMWLARDDKLKPPFSAPPSLHPFPLHSPSSLPLSPSQVQPRLVLPQGARHVAGESAQLGSAGEGTHLRERLLSLLRPLSVGDWEEGEGRAYQH